ncbi:DegV family protein [Mycoplasma sp. 744]|uniref:DegV family protein n=1 Tax=Mycoplasma sp. 744 TaxID=3108531 RepID=UPI002B1D0BAD|nr:DegV family protein [Mycoplasma sp. 744]MEA4115642.1 DegV family protein [Mycoplasma sp. 744]
MKYAIIVDSSCGLTKEEANKKGWFYLPLHIIIDGKEYKDGIEINSSNLFQFYKDNNDAKTSAINIGEAQELFEQLSKEYDQIIVYPISQHLSGTYQMLNLLSQDFPKVRIVKSKQIVQLIILDLLWLETQLSNDSSKLEEYLDFIENKGFRNSITLIPKYNKYLVKGGRLHPSAALVAKMLNIVPLITFSDGKLLKEGVGRVFKKTVLKNIASKSNFKLENQNNELCYIYLHSNAKIEEQNEIVNEFSKIYNIKPLVHKIAPVVSIHTGPEAYVGIVLEINKELKEKLMKFLNHINL